VSAPVVEPELPELLEGALTRAIRRERAAGSQEVRSVVQAASFTPSMGADGVISAWRVELAVEFTLLGPEPRSLALRRARLVAPASSGAWGLPEARSAAFADLCDVLAAEAVAAFLYTLGEIR
jgi:hypothetical protein